MGSICLDLKRLEDGPDMFGFIELVDEADMFGFV